MLLKNFFVKTCFIHNNNKNSLKEHIFQKHFLEVAIIE